MKGGGQTHQQELLRHHYLAQLGVTSWLPRAVLPGAAPSNPALRDFVHHPDSYQQALREQDCAVVDDQTDDVQTLAPTQIEHHGSGPDEEAADAADPAPAASVRTPAVSPATSNLQSHSPVATTALPAVKLAARADKAAPPRFKLAFWRCGALLLIDSLPPQRQQAPDFRRYRALLNNLLCALTIPGQGRPAEQLTEQPPVLDWPVLAGERLDQSPAVARRAVQYKLTKQLADQPDCRWLVLLGSAAAQQVLGREESLDELRGLIFSHDGQIRCISSFSLTQMLQISEYKKQVWEDLQPLRQAL